MAGRREITQLSSRPSPGRSLIMCQVPASSGETGALGHMASLPLPTVNPSVPLAGHRHNY